MNRFFCKFCGKKIPKWMRSNAVFCNDNCKKRDYDIRKGRVKLKDQNK